MTDTLSAKAAQVLEWQKVLEYVAQGAQSVLGAARCRAMGLDNDLEVLARRQRETTEWLSLNEGSDPAPVLTFPDARELVERAGKGGVLEALELRDCGLVLARIDEVARYCARHAHEALTVVAMRSEEHTSEL